MPVQVRYLVRQAILALSILMLFATWSAVRTDRFLKGPVDRALSRLGSALGGSFSYMAIRPAGLTGIELEELSFTQSGLEPQRAHATSVRLFPDLAALLRGRFRIDDVECVGLTGRVSESHWSRWLEELAGEPGDSPSRVSRPSGLPLTALRRIWPSLPERVLIRSAQITLDLPSSRQSPPTLDIDQLILVLGGPEGPPSTEIRGEVALRGVGRSQVVGSWVAGQGAHLELRFASPLDLGVPPMSDWLSTLSDIPPVPEGSTVTIGGIEIRWPVSHLTFTDVAVANLMARIPAIDRWRLDGFEAERIEVSLAAGGPSFHVESGQLLFSGILEWVNLGLVQADVWPDRRWGQPSASLLFAEPSGGTLAVSVSRSAFGGDLAVTFDADLYPVSGWESFLPDGFPAHLVDGRFDGEVVLSLPAGSGQTLVSIDGALSDGVALVPVLSLNPLTDIDLHFQGDILVDPRHGSVKWQQGIVRVGSQEIRLDGEMGWPDGDLDLALNATTVASAAELLGGLPDGLAPSLSAFAWEGELSALLYLDLDTARPEEAVVDLTLDLSKVRVGNFSSEVPLDTLEGDFALAIRTENGQGRTIGPSTESWVSLAEVSPYLVSALVSAEDTTFWEHQGFDWPGIVTSLQENLRTRRFARGGSTISQQVARSLFLGNERTLGRKFEEAVLTWQMEQLLSKERIMELYLNAVHWGPDRYGIREAAATYFHRPPDELTLRESVFLAAILPNPDLFGIQYAQHIVVGTRRDKMCRILQNMRATGQIDYSEYRESCSRAARGEISVAPVPEYLDGYGRGDDVDVPASYPGPPVTTLVDPVSPLRGLAGNPHPLWVAGTMAGEARLFRP